MKGKATLPLWPAAHNEHEWVCANDESLRFQASMKTFAKEPECEDSSLCAAMREIATEKEIESAVRFCA